MSSIRLPSVRNSVRLSVLVGTIVALLLAFAAESRAALVAAGWTQSCGIKESGALACWGTNSQGALGTGAAQSPTYDPVPVQGLGSGVTHITIGADSPTACAIASGGARCWGSNNFGKLGNGTTTPTESNTPVQVTGLETGVTKISANTSHVCAVHNGAAKCWGAGHAGRLGNGSANQSQPVTATGLESGVTDIAAGWRHTCAIKAGTIYCFGDNTQQQLGSGASGPTPTPLSSPPPGQAVRITAGLDLSCAVMDSGAAYCWGSNGDGKLGAGIAPGGEFRNPQPVTGMSSEVSDIHSNDQHACAIKSGTAFCWGDGANGKLGNGGIADSNVPVQVSNISGVTSIGAGSEHSCAVAGGKHYCWGENDQRQLGANIGSQSTVPVEVTGMTPPPPDGDVDGVPDATDNCPATPNGDQADLDASGGGDACDADDDGDGVADSSDACPRQSGSANGCPDGDADGVADAQDNCPTVPNGDQTDLDGSSGGDACDDDDDGDGVVDSSDACPRQRASGPDGCPQQPPPPPPPAKLVQSKKAPASLPAGGKALTLTPNQPCQVTSKTTIPKSSLRRSSAVGGFVSFGGARFTVPRHQTMAWMADRPVVIPVRPVTAPAKPNPGTRRQPDPPPIKVQTTTTCKPIQGFVMNPSYIGFAGGAGSAFGAISGKPAVTKTTVTVNPPPAPPIDERKPKAGKWGGKVAGLQKGAPNGIRFQVDSKGRVFDFEAAIAETCHVPVSGGPQAPGVTSLPRFTNLRIGDPMASVATNGGFPRTVVYEYRPPDSEAGGTKWIRLGGGSVPGITFTGEDSAHGTIAAVRIPGGGVQGARCEVDVRFDARAGQNPGPINSSVIPDYVDD